MRFLAVCCISVVLSLSGCILPPVLDAVSRIGITEGDRRALLNERVGLIKHAFSWQRRDDLLTLTEPERQNELSKIYRGLFQGRKIVDVTAAGTDMAPGATECVVEVTIRSYKVPVFIVQEETKYIVMSFKVSRGWLIHDLLDKPPA